MPTSKQKNLFVIIGPTAVGKTSLCVDIAKKFEMAVVSADSRQFYKEMSIGTAKPSNDEMAGVPHYFIDNKSIKDTYNVGLFEKEAMACLDEIYIDNNNCILTGGAGLFIDAICNGFDDMPKIPSTLRTELNNEYKNNGLAKLASELEQVDPKYYKKVDVKNPQRVIRALEICRFTGKTYTSFRKKQIKNRPFQIIKIGLERNREELYNRIERRIDVMIDNGLFEEAGRLYTYKEHNALKTVGYIEVFNYMDGLYDKTEAIRLLKRNTRRYAKRQITWFKRFDDIKWFHPDEILGIEKYIELQIDQIQ